MQIELLLPPLWLCKTRLPKVQASTPLLQKLVAAPAIQAGVDRIITMDLHAGQIQGFFDIPVDDLTSRIAFANDIKMTLPDAKGTVFVSPDAGGTVRARKFANMFGGDVAIVDKRRFEAGKSLVMNLIGKVKGLVIS